MMETKRLMRKILRATLLFVEIVASVWAVDFGLSMMSAASDLFLIGGFGLLFLVGAFWFYKYEHMKHRRMKEGGIEKSEDITHWKVRDVGDTFGHTLRDRLRDPHWPWKRRDQG
jgi:hypothetical protein